MDLESKSDKSKVLSNVIPVYLILRNRNSWYFDFSVLNFSQIGRLGFGGQILTKDFPSF